MPDYPIPVALFAYARPDCLARTLAALRENGVPKLVIFCDGARGNGDEIAVRQVREQAESVDWCEHTIVHRDRNLGLGAAIIRGVTEVLAEHEALLVFEDDVICVPGTYAYLVAALTRYRNDSRVMSVCGWNHPRVRPPVPPDEPFFDGRFACLAWGTWRRAWRGMDEPAALLLRRCRLHLRDVDRYGTDLRAMAQDESRNMWAVRFCLLHILRRGLCLHAPQSLVRHVGYDARATNASEAGIWELPDPSPCPPIPVAWPEPREHADLPRLWQAACGAPGTMRFRTRLAVGRLAARWRFRWSVIRDPEGVHSLKLGNAVGAALGRFRTGQFEVALDHGCGSRPYRALIRRVARRDLGADIGVNPLADVTIRPGGELPFADASIDLITSFMVLEHVEDPAVHLRELARVCRPSGRLVMSVPSVWPYHPHPTDFRRWMITGLVSDIERAGFAVERHTPVLNPVATSVQYFLSVCRQALRHRGSLPRAAFAVATPLLNLLVWVGDRWCRGTLAWGAGCYVVEARRLREGGA